MYTFGGSYKHTHTFEISYSYSWRRAGQRCSSRTKGNMVHKYHCKTDGKVSNAVINILHHNWSAFLLMVLIELWYNPIFPTDLKLQHFGCWFSCSMRIYRGWQIITLCHIDGKLVASCRKAKETCLVTVCNHDWLSVDASQQPFCRSLHVCHYSSLSACASKVHTSNHPVSRVRVCVSWMINNSLQFCTTPQKSKWMECKYERIAIMKHRSVCWTWKACVLSDWLFQSKGLHLYMNCSTDV